MTEHCPDCHSPMEENSSDYYCPRCEKWWQRGPPVLAVIEDGHWIADMLACSKKLNSQRDVDDE